MNLKPGLENYVDSKTFDRLTEGEEKMPSLKNQIDSLWKEAEYSPRPMDVGELTEEHRRLADKYATLCAVVERLLERAPQLAKDQVAELLNPNCRE